jgi:error-prone DNA polymerase
MGFYAPAQIVRDARQHGIEVRPPDVNWSEWDYTLEPARDGDHWALRIGLRQIKGLAQEDADWLVAARGNAYADPHDIWRRAGLSPAVLETLANADAFQSLELTRREVIWHVKALGERPLPLFTHAAEREYGAEPAVSLPEMPLGEQVIEDYHALRLSLKAHPVKLLRPALCGIAENASLMGLKADQRVSVCGLVIARQRPGTAKGVIFATLEDETGVANIIIWSSVYEKYRRTVLTARLLMVRGRVQREGIVIHVLAEHLEDRSHLLGALGGRGLTPPYAPADEVAHPNGHDSRDPPKPRPIPRPRHPREQAKVLFPSRDFH